MQINFGSKTDLRSMLFEPPRQSDIDYLRDRMESKISLFDTARTQFSNTLRNTFEAINNSAAMSRARALYRSARSFFDVDDIRSLFDIEDIQIAKPTMQEYIMAEPTIRDLYHRQLVDGYSGTYVDMAPKTIGWGHKPYDQAMHGVLVEDPENDTLGFGYSLDLDLHVDEQITVLEQQHVHETWNYLREYMKTSKIDPTDCFGGERGD